MNTPSLANRKLNNLSDQLATVRDLNEAIHMACGYIADDNQKQAIQAVTDAINNQLRIVIDSLDEIREALA